MAGRPTKLSDEAGDAIVEAISLGLSYKAAAAIAGVDETTLHRWRKRGRESGRQPYRQFCQRIDAAQASTARDYLQAVRRSVIEPTVTTKTTTRTAPDGGTITETVKTVSPPGIKGALWWLERRLPELFAPPHKPDRKAAAELSGETGANNGPVEILLVKPMTPAEAQEAAEAANGARTSG